MTELPEVLAKKLLKQASSCDELGSPLYGSLLRQAAEDVTQEGPTLDVLRPFADEPAGGALALKLMGSVHRMVLERRAPALAQFYPSVGGHGRVEEAWQPFRALIADERDTLVELMKRPVQTNEVGRSAGLLGGFLEVARSTRLPLRLLEVGASSGLNLRWDQYRYTHRDLGWGPEDSPVRMSVFDPPPPLDVDVRISSRKGCDPNPLDPNSAADRLTLSSYVWPDQERRWQRLKGAFEVASKVPVTVECSGAADWLERELAMTAPGEATVVFHSIVMQYVSPEERDQIVALMRRAGAAATPEAPLAWLRMEPPLGHLGRFFAAEDEGSPVHGWLFPEPPSSEDRLGDLAVVTLTTWPGEETRTVARAGYHGDPVVWLGGP